jgi:hypothetical protein
LFKEWFKRDNPSGSIMGRNTFMKDLQNAIVGSSFQVPVGCDKVRTAGRMDKTETLIATYNLVDWQTPGLASKFSTIEAMCRPVVADSYRGLVRVAQPVNNNVVVDNHVDNYVDNQAIVDNHVDNYVDNNNHVDNHVDNYVDNQAIVDNHVDNYVDNTHVMQTPTQSANNTFLQTHNFTVCNPVTTTHKGAEISQHNNSSDTISNPNVRPV